MTVGILCLTSCVRADYSLCPVYPIAGADVARELSAASYENFPHTWEWLARIRKLQLELELCREPSSETAVLR